MDDDKRLLIALISDSGMRFAEALGLAKDDLKIDVAVPHIDLKPHPWRSLKTASSTRTVPLVGASLRAAQRLAEHTSGPLLFPRYASPQRLARNGKTRLRESIRDGETEALSPAAAVGACRGYAD
jgi:integrase